MAYEFFKEEQIKSPEDLIKDCETPEQFERALELIGIIQGTAKAYYPDELITKFNVMDALQYGKESVKSGKGWNTPFVTGQLKDGTFVHVYITEAPTQTF